MGRECLLRRSLETLKPWQQVRFHLILCFTLSLCAAVCGNALTDVDVLTCPEIVGLPLHAVALEMVQIWIIMQLNLAP